MQRRMLSAIAVTGLGLAVTTATPSMAIVDAPPGAAASAKKAHPITVSFTAKIVSAVTEIDTPPVSENLTTAFGLKAGDVITGEYSYGSMAVDTNPDVGVGDYQWTTAPYGMVVKKGNRVVAQSDPANVNMNLEVANNIGSPPSDSYVVQSNSNLGGIDQFTIQLVDSSAKAIKSDALPLKAPELRDWDSSSPGLTIAITGRTQVGVFIQLMATLKTIH